jgi:hypothetical protein
MTDFVLIFRRDLTIKEETPSPAQMAATVKQWQDWIGGIAAQNKLSSPPRRMSLEGRVVKANDVVTNGPYSEIKEGIGGAIFVRANDFDEAVSMAKGCPVLHFGGNVEVRQFLNA